MASSRQCLATSRQPSNHEKNGGRLLGTVAAEGVHAEMWLRSERKGGYTRLEDRSRTMLMQLGLAPETYDFAAE